MVFGFNKKKQQCSAANARFLILLLLGREPHISAECDVYTDMRFFGALKRLLASRAFGQTLIDPFIIGKATMRRALTPQQSAFITDMTRQHFGLTLQDAAKNRWPHCLLAVFENERFQKAFLSSRSFDQFSFVKQHLEAHTGASSETYTAALHQTTGNRVRGIACRDGQTAPIDVDFYLNGSPAGCTTADQINREIGEHLASDGMVAFDGTLELPPSVGQDDAVLHIFDRQTGVLLCPPREVLLHPQAGAALLARTASAVDVLQTANTADPAVREALDDLAARLPSLDQISAFTLDDYDLYTRIYAPGAPPQLSEQIKIAVVVDGKDTALARPTLNSIDRQSHRNFILFDTLPEETDMFDLVITVAAGDMLDPHALAWFAASAASNPEAQILRASSDRIDSSGMRSDPAFIWQFDPLILMQDPTYASAFAVRPANLEGRSDEPAHALWQQVYKAHGTDGFASIKPVIWSRFIAQAPAPNALAVPDSDGSETLAIIIPTRDGLPLIKPCVESLCKTLAHPGSTEIIIVDNGSTDGDTLAWLQSVPQPATDSTPAIRVIEDAQSFNWAAINNQAAAASDATYLLFLNNDTLAIDKGWDRTLRGMLNMDGVGLIGAKLLYGDDTIQHAGVILDSTSLALHEGAGAASDDPGYSNRHILTRQCSAVTGAFMACRRTDFNAVGGFDAENFAVTFNDIDFCLRMNAAGRQCVYTPLISFYHLESKSRGYDGVTPEKAARARREHETLRSKWQAPGSASATIDPWCPDAFETSGHKPFTVLRRPKRYI